jgi:hypothetical protein
MSATVRRFRRVPAEVDAIDYDGTATSIAAALLWIRSHGGTGFEAKELGWRHDFGTYHHSEHGFIYLPQGARTAGSPIEMLRDDELIVRTEGGAFAVVFPGDYIVRSRHGFYPLSAESFHRSYRADLHRRGTGTTSASPPS